MGKTKSKYHLLSKRHNGRFRQNKKGGQRAWLKTRHRMRKSVIR